MFRCWGIKLSSWSTKYSKALEQPPGFSKTAHSSQSLGSLEPGTKGFVPHLEEKTPIPALFNFCKYLTGAK